ncbi:unnamed protein product [Cuscuta epithymum]|uniref:Uncharacterized protein n=1 Tax=Cuscuta epithymum TaxID=186058 RepID=A0AAV0EB41_9ASTE|nr:unnamed protein product [Cuscuta epithymum]
MNAVSPQCAISGGDESAEDRLAGGPLNDAAAGAREHEGARELEHLRHPVHDHHLQLGRRWRREPVEADGVEAGGEHFPDESRGADGRREERKEVRAQPVGHPRNYVLLNVPQNGFELLRQIGSRRRLTVEEVPGLNLAENRVGLDIFVIVSDKVNHAMSLSSELFHIKGIEFSDVVCNA